MVIIASVILLGAAVIYYLSSYDLLHMVRIFEKKANRERNRLLEEFENKLLKEVTPQVKVYYNIDEVSKEAGRILTNSHKDKIATHRYISFYGSAPLSSPDPHMVKFGDSLVDQEDLRHSPHHFYSGSLESAVSDQMLMNRYINLFTEEELKGRNRFVLANYRDWLKAQVYHLRRNHNYTLVKSFRAPYWGANISRIETHNCLLEIYGRGFSALVLNDEESMSTFYSKSKKYIDNAKDNIYYNDQYGNIQELTDTVDKISSMLQNHGK